MATGIFSLLGIKNSKDGGSSGPSATLPNKSKFTDRDTSDFGFMDRNKFNTEIMSYPQGVEDDPSQGHYMLFFIKSRKDAEIEFQKPGTTAPGTASGKTSFIKGINTTSSDRKDILSSSGRSVKGVSLREPFRLGKTAAGGSVDRIFDTFSLTEDVISLYMPPGISNVSTISYDATELGLIGGLAKQGKVDAAEALAVLQGSDNITSSSLVNAVTAFKETAGLATTQVIKETGKAAANLVGLNEIAQTTQRIVGRAVNPHLEILFKGVGLREFSYTFKFIPKNEKEVEQVHKIIKTFRRHAHPTFDKITAGGYFVVPSQFELHYMYKGVENPWYNRIGDLVCTGVSVNYGPTEQQTFRPVGEAPPPIEIDMTVNFTETEIVTKEKVDEGF
jgi:hypothetical protein